MWKEQRQDGPEKGGWRWLETHQDREGFWPATSANLTRKDDDAFVGFFMRDAASGYAVLALGEADGPRSSLLEK